MFKINGNPCECRPRIGNNLSLSLVIRGAATPKAWVGSSLEPRKYKPIKVDNWGIFLLSRLQTYFQKKEYTDLTLRFPEKNAIKPSNLRKKNVDQETLNRA